jgi:hypothetical protein
VAVLHWSSWKARTFREWQRCLTKSKHISISAGRATNPSCDSMMIGDVNAIHIA